MRNKLFLSFLIFLFVMSPALSNETRTDGPNSSYMSLDEYSRLFEIGFFDDENAGQETEQEFIPVAKKEINADNNQAEIIELEAQPVKLNIKHVDFLEPYKEVFETPTTKTNLYKTNKITLFADGSKELSDYMTNNFKSTMNISFDANKYLSFKTGHEVWYVNPDASIGSKKFYFNPVFNLSKQVCLDYTSRYNQTNRNIEQEVGLNYKPKFFKDTASFSIKASTVMNDNSEVLSKKLKFSTDWYIF